MGNNSTKIDFESISEKLKSNKSTINAHLTMSRLDSLDHKDIEDFSKNKIIRVYTIHNQHYDIDFNKYKFEISGFYDDDRHYFMIESFIDEKDFVGIDFIGDFSDVRSLHIDLPLTYVPNLQLFENLELLQFTSNKITVINNKNFYYPSIKELYINSESLKEIKGNLIFSEKLKDLTLSEVFNLRIVEFDNSHCVKVFMEDDDSSIENNKNLKIKFHSQTKPSEITNILNVRIEN